MPAIYRIELAKSGRAGCKGNKECKESGEKIQKGELRFGTFVEIGGEGGHSSWQWRHWGCLTPKILANLKEVSGGDLDLVDGYEELEDEDLKAKVRRALEQGHVDDEDWKGDTEFNRPGKTGFKSRGKKKQDGEEANEEQTPKKPKGKKRKATDDQDEEDEAPAKKSKGNAKKSVKSEDAEADADEVAPPKKARGRPKKAVKSEEVDGEEEVKPKKAKKTKKAEAEEDLEVDNEEAEEPEPTKKGRGRPKKAAGEPAPQKKSRAKKT